jgi:zinc finger protein
MSNTHEEDPKPDGKVFDDFFDSIGNKAENVAASNGEKEAIATNGARLPEEEQKVVDEIESLCMNCRENASDLMDHSFHN